MAKKSWKNLCILSYKIKANKVLRKIKSNRQFFLKRQESTKFGMNIWFSVVQLGFAGGIVFLIWLGALLLYLWIGTAQLFLHFTRRVVIRIVITIREFLYWVLSANFTVRLWKREQELLSNRVWMKTSQVFAPCTAVKTKYSAWDS